MNLTACCVGANAHRRQRPGSAGRWAQPEGRAPCSKGPGRRVFRRPHGIGAGRRIPRESGGFDPSGRRWRVHARANPPVRRRAGESSPASEGCGAPRPGRLVFIPSNHDAPRGRRKPPSAGPNGPGRGFYRFQESARTFSGLTGADSIGRHRLLHGRRSNVRASSAPRAEHKTFDTLPDHHDYQVDRSGS